MTWRGWLAVLALTAGAGCVLAAGIYPFLAVTHRVDAQDLVVEGWVDDEAIAATIAEFRSGHYQHIFATGGPAGDAARAADFDTAAAWGAGRLLRAGISRDIVKMVPANFAGRDRTYMSAVALRDWLRKHDLNVAAVNVVTMNAHARRTRLLFQEALGPRVNVGIIAVPNPGYNARDWWRGSEGVREVLSETIAYLYAKFLFWPSLEEPGGKG